MTTDTENNLSVIGVEHEAFLTAWPPLAEAITRHVAALRNRRAVETGAAEWDAGGRHRDRLWERGQLAAALNDLDDPTQAGDRPQPAQTSPSRVAPCRSMLGRRRLRGTAIELSPRARDFLTASIRTDRRRRTRGTTILTGLLVAALVAAVVAVIQQRSAREQQRVAQDNNASLPPDICSPKWRQSETPTHGPRKASHWPHMSCTTTSSVKDRSRQTSRTSPTIEYVT